MSDVIVRVLGDIRVDGYDLTGKQTALVAYLALHREVSSDRLEAAVWPTPGSHRKVLTNTVGKCRRVLGEQHLPAAADGRYRAGPHVTTDAELFDRLLTRSNQQHGMEAAGTLRSALTLVTGRIFSYIDADRASYSWVDIENWTSRWELEIARTAERCAQLFLEAGCISDAVAVAERALSIVPADARLTEALMKAHGANDDRTSVLRVLESHVGALDALGFGEPLQSTLDLYVEISRASCH